MVAPLSAGQVCHGVGGAPVGPVPPLSGWLLAGDRVCTRRMVFGVAEPGFLWGGLQAACMVGPMSAGQVCHGVGVAPVGPVPPLSGWLLAGDRVCTRRMVFGVAEPGFLWGSGPGPCAGVRCQGAARVGCPLPPYSWGWARLCSRQVTPGAPGSLWPCGVVVGVVVPPVWTHAVVGGSVARRPSMMPERP